MNTRRSFALMALLVMASACGEAPQNREVATPVQSGPVQAAGGPAATASPIPPTPSAATAAIRRQTDTVATAPQRPDDVRYRVAARTAASAAAGPPEQGATYAIVRTFFGTDRNLTGDAKPSLMFGVDRSPMHYGFADVSIPAKHEPGELESPSIWRLQFSENPEKHVVLLRSTVLPKDQYFSEVAARLKASNESVLLFVHGYNVTFEDAARRTAQMTYDLKFAGVPIFFSWPSKGNEALYTHDENEIEWAEVDLKRFLDNILVRPETRNVYIIAHSMGNRAMTRSLGALLTEKPDFRSKVREIILAAPDIDAGVFKSAIAPALIGSGRPITLYASADDRALQWSMKVHGQARLGAAGGSLVVMPGVETIDATGVDTSFLAHSYYGSVGSVLSDIQEILLKGWRAARRSTTLNQMGSPPAAYWTFKKKSGGS